MESDAPSYLTAKRVAISCIEDSEGPSGSGEAIAFAFKARFPPNHPYQNPEIEL